MAAFPQVPVPPSSTNAHPTQLKQVEQEEVGPTPPNLYDEFLQSVRSELARAAPSLELGHGG